MHSCGKIREREYEVEEMMIILKTFAYYLRYQLGRKDQKRIAGQTAPTGVHVVKDMPYHGDKKKAHLLDVYYPKGEIDKLPVIINIHGGGLMYGYKEINAYYNMMIASYGYCVFNINYRLAPPAQFHEQLQDVLDAFAWIRERLLLTQYHGDIGNVYVTGDSAGALLALYATAISKNEALAAKFHVSHTPLDIKGLGLIHGMFYTTRDDMIGRLQPLFYGKKLQAPYYAYMDPKKLLEKAVLPPCYMVSSEDDELMGYTVDFEKELEAHAVPHKTRIFKKEEGKVFQHVFSVIDPFREESQQTMHEMIEYFQALQDAKEKKHE